MENKTALTELIERLEGQKKALKEMDLLGVLLDNEFIHKSNQITTIQLIISQYKGKEKQQIVDAYNQGYRDGEMDGVDNGGVLPIDIENYDDANKYFTQTFYSDTNQ